MATWRSSSIGGDGLRATVRTMARRMLGQRYGSAQRAWRALRPLLPWHARRRRQALAGTRRYVQRHGLAVRRGPFAGMLYTPATVGRTTLVPKLLGAYELELHAAVERALQVTRGCVVVNVGAGEGYYAVGLARRLQRSPVHAFDTDQVARRLCAGVAAANGVGEQVRIAERCGTADLRGLLADSGGLVVVDCESCELDLLDPGAVPELVRSTILVELHDWIVPGLTDALLRRFEDTHATEVIEARDRTHTDYQELLGEPAAVARLLISEGRPPGMRWAYLEPRTAA